jgi:hypothetical protein
MLAILMEIIGNSLARLLGQQPGELKMKKNTNSDVTINVAVGHMTTL